MSEKHLIFGATGSIGSSLAQQLKDSNQDAHLIARNKEELKHISEELAPNIRVNCIAPSLTDSKISQSMLKSNVVAEALAKAHPLKRLGNGSDSAALAKFLLSDDSSWVTGQIIGVDGGRSSLS